MANPIVSEALAFTGIRSDEIRAVPGRHEDPMTWVNRLPPLDNSQVELLRVTYESGPPHMQRMAQWVLTMSAMAGAINDVWIHTHDLPTRVRLNSASWALRKESEGYLLSTSEEKFEEFAAAAVKLEAGRRRAAMNTTRRDGLPANAGSPNEEYDSRLEEIKSLLDGAPGRLSARLAPDQLTLLQMRYLQEMRPFEIAEALNSTPTAVIRDTQRALDIAKAGLLVKAKATSSSKHRNLLNSYGQYPIDQQLQLLDVWDRLHADAIGLPKTEVTKARLKETARTLVGYALVMSGRFEKASFKVKDVTLDSEFVKAVDDLRTTDYGTKALKLLDLPGEGKSLAVDLLMTADMETVEVDIPSSVAWACLPQRAVQAAGLC